VEFCPPILWNLVVDRLSVATKDLGFSTFAMLMTLLSQSKANLHTQSGSLCKVP
jgi:hypothetical protein